MRKPLFSVKHNSIGAVGLIKILGNLIESVDLAVYSYVKPGAPHRYSLYEADLHKYVKTVTVSLESYQDAVQAGVKVARGATGFPKCGIGKIISNALLHSASKLGTRSWNEIHLILIPVTTAASYAITAAKSMSLSIFAKGLSDVMMFSDVKDTVEVYKALRMHGGKYSTMIDELGVTKSKLEIEKSSLSDLYTLLGEKDKLLNAFSKGSEILTSVASKFTDILIDTGDYNYASLTAYFDLLKSLEYVKIPTKKIDRSTAMELLKLDREFKREGKNFNYLLPLLAATIFLGLLSIEFAH